MQKFGTEEHTKTGGNTLVTANPKSLHYGANSKPQNGVSETAAQFRRNLKEDGKSLKTVESYVGDVTAFLEYLQVKGADVQSGLRRFHVTSYRSHLLEAGYEAATINKKINSLHAFNRYLLETGEETEMVVDVKRDKVKVATGSEREVEVYGEPLVERLLFYVQSDKVSKRGWAVMLALLYTGVMVSEVCDIRVKNVDFLTGHLRVMGKGGKVREVPLKPEVVDALREYLTERTNSPYSNSDNLFLGQRGHLQLDAVNTLLRSTLSGWAWESGSSPTP